MEKIQCLNSSFAEVNRRSKSDHQIFFNFLEKIDIFGSIPIVSNNIILYIGFR
jgi:hypothetical protein